MAGGQELPSPQNSKKKLNPVTFGTSASVSCCRRDVIMSNKPAPTEPQIPRPGAGAAGATEGPCPGARRRSGTNRLASLLGVGFSQLPPAPGSLLLRRALARKKRGGIPVPGADWFN